MSDSPPPVLTSSVELGSRTRVPGAHPELTALVARPAEGGPWPAVVLVHEAFGLNEVTRRQIVHLAGLGYLVVAPDLFAAGGAVRCLRSTFRDLMAGSGPAFQDVETARVQALDDADCTGKVGIIGFCMGGGFALALAPQGYAASAPCYGRLPETPEALRGACPIVASYGAKDRQLPGAAAKLERALTAYGIPHDVKEYPGAGHAFMNDASPLPAVFDPLLKIGSVAPVPAAAADAWARIDAFFRVHLAADAPAGPTPA